MVWCGAGDGAVGGLTAASIPGSAISTSARWDCLAKETDESAAIRISPSVLSSSFSVLLGPNSLWLGCGLASWKL